MDSRPCQGVQGTRMVNFTHLLDTLVFGGVYLDPLASCTMQLSIIPPVMSGAYQPLKPTWKKKAFI